MGDILNRTVQRAVSKGYIPASEQQAVISKVEQLANKYQFSPDDYAIFSMMETDGFDPKAFNGNCGGIIQFCNGSGADLVGRSAESITQLSVMQQLDLVDKYFAGNSLPKGAELEDLYLTVLYPAARSEKNKDRDLQIPCCQATSLHTVPGNNVITKNSLRRGLLSIASQKLGISVDGKSVPPSGSSSALPGDYSSTGSFGQAIGNTLSAIKSAIFTSGNCPPPPYTQQDRIIYTGCQSKIQSAQQAGSMGTGYPAPSVGGVGNSETGLSNKPYGGQLKPGGFIKPANAPINSPFGWRWGRMHKGVDIAAPKGTPIYAAADGTVKYTITGCYLENTGTRSGDECGGGGYGNQIGIDHAGGFFTLYAHLHQILVKQGQEVKQGQQIGEMGSTGSSTGYHTHFELRKGEGGEALNPEDYF